MAKARATHGDFYDYSKSVYTGGLNPLTIVCPVHGEFQQRASDHANVGKGCKLCGVARSSPDRFSREEFIDRAVERHGPFYDYSLSQYNGYKKPVTVVCPVHGKFSQIAGKHLAGNGCPVCKKGRIVRKYKSKTREERFAEWLARSSEKHKGFYNYDKVVFHDSKTPVEIVCPEHGSFLQTPNNHVNGGCRCPVCADESKKALFMKPSEGWIDGFIKAHGEAKYDYSGTGEISSCLQSIPIVCPAHGVFRQQAYVHLSGHGCPKCSHKVSTPEDELYEWLTGILPGETVIRSTRKVISPYELDLYVPGRRVAVEFNGTYWHSDARKSKLFHQKKSLLCRDKGILLVHVYEYDWVLRQDACKRLLTGKLGINGKPYHARLTEVRPVGPCREFLEANHFQGTVSSSVRYGLFYGGEMLALMTFGRPRYTENHTWELLRFCSLSGVRVRGGAGKLFRRFVRDHLRTGDTVVSYARLDYSAGGVYKALGFAEDGICPPDYVWVKQSLRVLGRQSTQKHRLPALLGDKFDAAKSEAGNMRDAGYKRIYSAGNLRYVYTHA